jgi:two-component system sensor histidine kinase AlgZ
MPSRRELQRPVASGWLPELCRWEPFLMILLGAELVAIVAVLAPLGSADVARGADWWSRIGPVSLYVQWLTLTCTVCLCVGRAQLLRMPAPVGGSVAWLLCLLICLLGATAIGLLDRELGLGLTGSADTLPQFVFGSTASAAVLAAAALRYAFVHNQWRQQVQAHARAEADALQARIRPHFLFNSLNTIASLISVRPEAAVSALLDLSDLFRASLKAGEHSVRLDEEVLLCKRYLAIEGERLGDRLQQSWSLDLPDALALPPLTLQPLVENAVYHGIQAMPEGGLLRVSGRRNGEHWLIEVRNPVPSGGAGHRGSGQAVANIRARLRHRFGDRADLTCESGSDYHVARLWIPVHEGPDR